MPEEFRPIKGYEGVYEISNHGQIRSFTKKEPFIMKQSVHYKGHMYIYLQKGGRKNRQKFFVHRLVAVAFIPNPQMKLIVNHIDEVKHNNIVTNLEWMTEGENTRYYWARKGVEINPGNLEF